jgi:16S rRNA (cytosine1402-N4)-methyltransferase
MRRRGPGHLPVLREEVLRLLRPSGRRLLLDVTVGHGGHAQALLNAAGADARLIGIDLDEASLRRARDALAAFGQRVRLFRANFADVSDVLAQAGEERADLLLADLGVSSGQLDDPAYGLSFSVDGPLDMRLSPQAPRSAADLVNELPEAELADLIFRFGEERYSRRIARAIAVARRKNRIERTLDLARIVTGAIPPAVRRRRRGVHEATRTFLAIRAAVNDEHRNLQRLLAQLPDILAPGARAGIVSFHSLEDGPVKRSFACLAAGGAARLVTKKPVTPTAAEVAENPRSRAARLRVIEMSE